MKIERFEDLDCWKAARELVKLSYKFTREIPFCRDFGLRDQIQRAAMDLEYIGQGDFDIAFGKAQDCISLCGGLIRYLKDKT